LTRRELTAGATGPVTLHASLLQQLGTVDVRVDPACERGSLVVSTRDDSGRSAETVEAAALRWLYINGQRVDPNNVGAGAGGQAAPIEITAIVPPGSVLVAETTMADVRATGLTGVKVSSQSGDVVVDTADTVTVRTQSGSITIGQAGPAVTAKAQSGDVRIHDFTGGTAQADVQSGRVSVHATGPGQIRAGSMTGRIDVTAADSATAAGLDIRTNSISGRVSVPQEQQRKCSPTSGIQRRARVRS
jgi:hypothetical protein